MALVTHNRRPFPSGDFLVSFYRQAIEAIYEIGRGNLRTTGHLARKALELAHEAGSDTVDGNHVIQARGMVVCA